MRAAYRAVRILAELELAELHALRIEDQEAPDQWFAGAEDQLHRLGGLDAADDSRQYAKHTALSAAWNEPGRRRLRIQAAVARTLLRREHRRLPFEAEDAAIRIRLSEQHARVVHQIPRREIVRAVDDDVVGREELHRIL